MLKFAVRFVRPYWAWVVFVVVAMLVEAAASLASPWPLKIVLDSVLGPRPLPASLSWIPSRDRLAILNAAVLATVAIALLQAAAAYVNAYYSASIGQWIGHDLRQTVYGHLQRLSLSYYDRQQTGPLVSTITDDINAIQEFVSSTLLTILIDLLTITGMLVVMFSLNWNFTLVALSVTPLLALFVYRLRYVLKRATHEMRLKQSEIVSIV